MAQRTVWRSGKKLIEAARTWARGGHDNRQAMADLIRFGASEADARLWLAEDGWEDEPFLVWTANLPAFSLFMDLQTQWHRAPFGGITGLDYRAIRDVMALRGIGKQRRSALFDQLQTMERAALAALREG